MIAKIKKTLYALLLVAVVIFGYCLWLSLRPVEIIAVHQDGNYSDVLVKNFPLTDRKKTSWWLKNKDMLKEKYNIPQPKKDGNFTVIFWLFGDGYKETDGYDRLCFEDMPPPKNCIDKNRVFSANHSRNMGVSFIVIGGIYRLKENGDIVRVKL
ncbi:MAG: DUF943 family protein [Pantoea sp.]|uniref:DUF943 family protein n=1 Tax=Pantoea septica TaxID=472695 RepID=A0ABX3UPQ1_9GAMM|nr:MULTISPECIES: DUF943 family protein [Pantoea]MDU5782791.1 DUF943 family protein [Pantoea sp.]ORM97604.1 hypothetical protein HA46_14700 [Pantoea septica]